MNYIEPILKKELASSPGDSRLDIDVNSEGFSS